MKNFQRTRAGLIIVGSAASLLVGCSTPKPIRDLAGQGAATVTLSEAALRVYLDSTNAHLTARMELMRAEARSEELDAGKDTFERYIDKEAGVPQVEDLVQKVRTLGAERQKIREDAIKKATSVDTKYAFEATKLLTLPTEKLGAARKSFQVLAQELKPSEWLDLFSKYAKEVKTGIDKLKEPPPAADSGASAPAGTN